MNRISLLPLTTASTVPFKTSFSHCLVLVVPGMDSSVIHNQTKINWGPYGRFDLFKPPC